MDNLNAYRMTKTRATACSQYGGGSVVCGKGRRTHFRKAALDPRGTLAACPRSVAIAVYSGVGGALSPRYPGTLVYFPAEVAKGGVPVI